MFTHTCYKLFILNMCLIMATIVNLTQICVRIKDLHETYSLRHETIGKLLDYLLTFNNYNIKE